MDEIEVYKVHFLNCWRDAVVEVLYYDRKSCEELPLAALEALLAKGDVTMAEILVTIKDAILKDYPDFPPGDLKALVG